MCLFPATPREPPAWRENRAMASPTPTIGNCGLNEGPCGRRLDAVIVRSEAACVCCSSAQIIPNNGCIYKRCCFRHVVYTHGQRENEIQSVKGRDGCQTNPLELPSQGKKGPLYRWVTSSTPRCCPADHNNRRTVLRLTCVFRTRLWQTQRAGSPH